MLLEVGKESVTLGSAVLVSSSKVSISWMEENLSALEPPPHQSSADLHAVISVCSPCIYTCLSHGA